MEGFSEEAAFVLGLEIGVKHENGVEGREGPIGKGGWFRVR